MSTVRRRWLVEGRVQGVFFRQSTVEEARRIGGIRGFVRNLPDGNVEVLAEAPEAALASLEDFLQRGPPAARVDGVRRVDAAGPMELGEFHLGHG